MPKITISEEDLTIKNDIDVTANTIYIPGISMREVSKPTTYTDVASFVNDYGELPYVFADDQHVSNYAHNDSIVVAQGNYEKSYIYAIELLQAGLSVCYHNIICLKDFITYLPVSDDVLPLTKETAKKYFLITPVGTTITEDNYRDFVIAKAGTDSFVYPKTFDATMTYYKVETSEIYIGARELPSGTILYKINDEDVLDNYYIQLAGVVAQGYLQIEDAYGTSFQVGSYNSADNTWTAVTDIANADYTLLKSGNFSYNVVGTIPYADADNTLGLPAGNRFQVKLSLDGVTSKSDLPQDETIAWVSNSLINGYNEYTASAFEADGSLIVVSNVPANKHIIVKIKWNGDDTKTYTYVFNCTTAILTPDDTTTAVRPTGQSTYATIIDKWEYNVKFITTGGYPTIPNSENESTYQIMNNMLTVAAIRGDAVSLIDGGYGENALDLYKNINLGITDFEKYTIEGGGTYFGIKLPEGRKHESTLKYGALISPSGIYKLYSSLVNYEIDDIQLPGSFGYLSCLANTIGKLKEPNYIAIAGITRGYVYNLKSLDSETTGAEADAVQERTKDLISLNPIVKVQNYGYCIWGNRTMFPNPLADLVASSFLNIRVLSADVKKIIYDACQKLTFETNSIELWLKFRTQIEPLLNKMISDGVLEKFEIARLETTKKATLAVYVKLYTIYAVEDFEITVGLTDSTVEQVG